MEPYLVLVAFVDGSKPCTLSQACAAVREFSDLPPAVVNAWGEAGTWLWLTLPPANIKPAGKALEALKVRVVGIRGIAPMPL